MPDFFATVNSVDVDYISEAKLNLEEFGETYECNATVPIHYVHLYALCMRWRAYVLQ